MPNARRIDITAIGIELNKVLSSRCEFLLEPIYADSLSPFVSRGAEATGLTDDDLWDLPHGQNLRTAEEPKNYKNPIWTFIVVPLSQRVFGRS